MSLRIAVAGSPHSTPSPSGTLKGLERAHELGINAMELEWVQRVPLNTEHIEEVGRKARELDIVLTVHAPYYVNLNAKEEEKLEKSKQRILQALTMAQICGAKSVCVHSAFYLGMDPTDVYENVRNATEDILDKKDKYFPDVNLAYETMGKGTQFGTLEELLELGKEFDMYPCVDFAHIHARYKGMWNSKEEWNQLFDTYAKYLGEESLSNMHMHYSGIEYGEKGERKHLVFEESDANWKEFVSVLKDRNIGGVLVCESPSLEEDTLLLKQEYKR